MPNRYLGLWVAVGVLGGAGILLSLWRRPRVFPWALGLLFISLGALHFARWHYEYFGQPWLQYLPLQVTAVQGNILSLRPGNSQTRVDIELRGLRTGHHQIPAKGRVRIYINQPVPAEMEGQSAEFYRVRLTAAPRPRNPGEFNYAFYLNTHGFVATARADSMKIVPDASFSIVRWVYPVRRFFITRIDSGFHQPYSGFIKALLLGYRQELDSEVRNAFQLAGLMHVLAISGLHVGFIAVLWLFLFQKMGIPLRWRYLLLFIILAGYALLTGAQPPVIRATVMITLWGMAKVLSRKSIPLNLLFAAALLVLIVQPNQIFWVGFQLSFFAVLFILAGLEWTNRLPWIRQLMKGSLLQRNAVRFVILPGMVTIWAQLGTLPFLLHYFHLISPIALVLNLIIIPVISVILYLGFAYVLLSFLFPIAATWLAMGITFLLHVLFQLVQHAVTLPFSHINWHHGVAMAIGVSAIAFIGVTIRHCRWRWVGIYSISFALIMFHLADTIITGSWDIVAIDVGQGDAIVIRTPYKSAIVVDTGPPIDHGYRTLSGIEAVFRTLRISRIHRLLISHPHWDHMGNLRMLIDNFPVDSSYYPDLPFSYPMQDSMASWLHQKGIPTRRVRAGTIVPVDAATQLYILAPFQTGISTRFQNRISGSVLNNHSVVAVVQMGNQRVLLPGDVERKGEIALLAWGSWLRANVLKVPHHGSRTSSVPEWIAAVNPEWALVSVGAKNRFGHPNPTVLQRLNQRGIQVLRTDTEGALWLRVRGNHIIRKQWRGRERFYSVYSTGKINADFPRLSNSLQ